MNIKQTKKICKGKTKNCERKYVETENFRTSYAATPHDVTGLGPPPDVTGLGPPHDVTGLGLPHIVTPAPQMLSFPKSVLNHKIVRFSCRYWFARFSRTRSTYLKLTFMRKLHSSKCLHLLCQILGFFILVLFCLHENTDSTGFLTKYLLLKKCVIFK